MQGEKDFDKLVDHVRSDMGPWLVGQVCAPGKSLSVITLDASLESAIIGGMRDPASGELLIEPDCARMIGEQIAELINSQEQPAALIVQPPARRALSTLLRTRAPDCLVLSLAELPAEQPVDVIAVVGAPAQEEPLQVTSQDNREAVAA